MSIVDKDAESALTSPNCPESEQFKNFIDNDWGKVFEKDVRSLNFLSITDYCLLQI
jgi:hypothetical protein